ncbi:MAG: restriction endonuclease subunit S [Campylobacterales bacterium]|nr:restriction endonuclease subunit S [Campylobacterales bacterium]
MIIEKNAKPLTDFVDVSDGNHLTISDYYCDNSGVPYYRGSDIYNFFIEQANSPLYIKHNIFESNNMKRSHLKKGDVLMSIVGAIIGNLSIVSSDKSATCSCKLAILRPKTIMSNFLAIFLKSIYGQNQIQKFKRGTAQTGLILEDFNQLLIPKVSIQFEKEITTLVQVSYQKLEQSKTLYQQAQNLLLEELDLLDFTPTNQEAEQKTGVSIKSFSESFGSSGRLDSEYYQPKYDEVMDKIKSYKGGIKPLSELVTTYRGNLIPDSYYSNKGKAYIRGADISSNHIQDNKVTFIDDTFEHTNQKTLQLNDLVFALIGTVGTVAQVQEKFIGSYISNNLGFMRLKSDLINSTVLHLILTSPKIGKLYFEQKEMRTAQPKISDKDIHDFVIPILDQTTQTEIETKIKESFALKEESKRLLEVAKRAVEIAIEQSEEEALEFVEA